VKFMPKQFTSKKPKLTFSIDEDDFEAYAVLPARKFAIFADSVDQLRRAGTDYSGPDKITLTFDQTITTILDAIELALTEDSAQRIAARISDADNPVDVNTLTSLLTWLLEEWGLAASDEARPTLPLSDSSSG